MEDYKLIRRINDIALSNNDKKYLILTIEYWQKERWKRLKKFHNFSQIPIGTRHFFMQQEIDLIRSQKERQQELLNDLSEDDGY